MLHVAQPEEVRPQLGNPEFSENNEQRTSCVILSDVSSSMSCVMADLQTALAQFVKDLRDDNQARLRVETALVTFGGQVQVAHDFALPDNLNIPRLYATGDTPMGEATLRALDMIDRRLAEYNEAGVPYTCPWIYKFTDGGPTDDIEEAVRRVRKAEAKKRICYFSVAVGPYADIDTLKRFSAERPPVVMSNTTNFQKMFEWLRVSLSSVSQSCGDGQQVTLPPVNGWGTVAT